MHEYSTRSSWILNDNNYYLQIHLRLLSFIGQRRHWSGGASRRSTYLKSIVRTYSRLCIRRWLPVALAALLVSPALADDVPMFKLVARDGAFNPSVIEVPAGKRIRLEISNE